jgi:hypothetical protein
MRPKGNRGVSFDPENCGHHALAEDAAARAAVLQGLASIDAATRTVTLKDKPLLRAAVERLSARHGPNVWSAKGPSDDAVGLACELALGSLAALRSLIGRRPITTAQGWRLHRPPLDVLPPQAGWGLPLIAACTPEHVTDNALDELAHLVDGLDDQAGLVAFQDNFRVRLAEAIQVELELWVRAAADGGLSPRIPYAFHFFALEWFWSPAAHAPGLRAPALCLRCGAMWYPSRRIGAPPRCAHCNNEDAKTRAWPTHAIAPDLRGLWWLRCQYEGCETAFVGQRHRHHCDEHISARLSHRQRRPRT